MMREILIVLFRTVTAATATVLGVACFVIGTDLWERTGKDGGLGLICVPLMFLGVWEFLSIRTSGGDGAGKNAGDGDA